MLMSENIKLNVQYNPKLKTFQGDKHKFVQIL